MEEVVMPVLLDNEATLILLSANNFFNLMPAWNGWEETVVGSEYGNMLENKGIG